MKKTTLKFTGCLLVSSLLLGNINIPNFGKALENLSTSNNAQNQDQNLKVFTKVSNGQLLIDVVALEKLCDAVIDVKIGSSVKSINVGDVSKGLTKSFTVDLPANLSSVSTSVEDINKDSNKSSSGDLSTNLSSDKSKQTTESPISSTTENINQYIKKSTGESSISKKILPKTSAVTEIKSVSTNLSVQGLPITVTVKYKLCSSTLNGKNDNSAKTTADITEPKVEELKVTAGTPISENDITSKITNLPERSETKVISNVPDTTNPGVHEIEVEITYPDGSTEKVKIKVTISPKVDELKVTAGTPISENDITSKIVNLPKDSKTKVIGNIPNTTTPGTHEVEVEITYPNGFTDKVTVKVVVEPNKPVTTVAPTTETVTTIVPTTTTTTTVPTVETTTATTATTTVTTTTVAPPTTITTTEETTATTSTE